MTNSILLSESTVYFDTNTHTAEISSFSFIHSPNTNTSELKKKEIQSVIKKFYKNKDIEIDYILNYEIQKDNYYISYLNDDEGKKKFYIFSQQENKDYEYELEGTFNSNYSIDDIKKFDSCCCLTEEKNWMSFNMINQRCPNLHTCTILFMKDFCDK